ncbi:MAG: hypothetical protein ACSLEN_14300 [Candidatus Malihini olakiniferum]
MIAEKHSRTRGGMKGNISFLSFDSSKKNQHQGERFTGVRPRVTGGQRLD